MMKDEGHISYVLNSDTFFMPISSEITFHFGGDMIRARVLDGQLRLWSIDNPLLVQPSQENTIRIQPKLP